MSAVAAAAAILQSVLDRERRGDYLGKTVQVRGCELLLLLLCLAADPGGDDCVSNEAAAAGAGGHCSRNRSPAS
jgi:hypothetical protein